MTELLGDVVHYVESLNKKPPVAQLGVSAGAGAVTSYILTKGGKMVAVTVGVTSLLFLIGVQNGYIVVNKKRVNNDVESIRTAVEKRVSSLTDIGSDEKKIKSFISRNSWIIGGFAAGSLIGFGLA